MKLKNSPPHIIRKSASILLGMVFGGTLSAIFILSFATKDSSQQRTVLDSHFSDSNHVRTEERPQDDVSDTLYQDVLKLYTSTQTTTNFVRKSKLYSLLIHADSNQLVELLNRSQNLMSKVWRAQLQSAILRRLATLDPRIALSLANDYPPRLRMVYLETIFREWSLLSVKDAIRAAVGLSMIEKRLALATIFGSRVDLTDSQRIDLGRDFGIEKFVSRFIAEEKALALAQDPIQAWAIVYEDGRNIFLRLDSLINVAKVWVNRDGVGVLDHILNSTENIFDRTVLERELVQSIALADPQAVFEQFATEPKLQRFLSHTVRVWTEKDPIGALRRVNDIEDFETRQRLTRTIVRAWSKNNPFELIEERRVLPEVMELTAISSAIRVIAKTQPNEAVRLMKSFENDGVFTWSITETLVDSWSERDPSATIQWLLSGENDKHPRLAGMVYTTLSRLARNEPKYAMKIALEQPIDSWLGAMEEGVVIALASIDLSQAIEFLPHVRDASRKRAYQGVGLALIKEGEPKHAVKLAQQLPNIERESYYTKIFDAWSSSNPELLLRSLQELPTENIRAIAAFCLITNQTEKRLISREEIEFAKAYLNNDYIDKLHEQLD